MIVHYQDRQAKLPRGTSVAECLAALQAEEGALAAMCGGQVLELTTPVQENCTLSPITLAQEEGRRIYERSLRMMMLLAVRRLFPREQVRIE